MSHQVLNSNFQVMGRYQTMFMHVGNHLNILFPFVYNTQQESYSWEFPASLHFTVQVSSENVASLRCRITDSSNGKAVSNISHGQLHSKSKAINS